jgi:ribosomal protein S18 acetylase RimI-like enzyme
MPLVIRRATIDDYEGICVLYQEGDAYHRTALPGIFAEYDGSARSFEYIAEQLADEQRRFFVAERDGEIVGILLMQYREVANIPCLVPRKLAYIDTIVVHEAQRGQGIGTALMERAHEQAREWQADHIELTVWEFNKEAQRFYSRRGYELSRRHLWLDLHKDDGLNV